MGFKGPAFAIALKRTYISCILHPKSGFSKTSCDINIFRLKLSDTISHQKPTAERTGLLTNSKLNRVDEQADGNAELLRTDLANRDFHRYVRSDRDVCAKSGWVG